MTLDVTKRRLDTVEEMISESEDTAIKTTKMKSRKKIREKNK